MPKKSFKNNPALAFIGNAQEAEPEESGTQEPHATHDTDDTHLAHNEIVSPPSEPPNDKYYRLNLKLKAEYKKYLADASWAARKSITEYVNDLIEADKARKDTHYT